MFRSVFIVHFGVHTKGLRLAVYVHNSIQKKSTSQMFMNLRKIEKEKKKPI